MHQRNASRPLKRMMVKTRGSDDVENGEGNGKQRALMPMITQTIGMERRAECGVRGTRKGVNRENALIGECQREFRAGFCTCGSEYIGTRRGQSKRARTTQSGGRRTPHIPHYPQRIESSIMLN